MANGQQGLRTAQDERDFIRRFVNDPGPIAIPQEQVRRRQPPQVRTESDQRADAARRRFIEAGQPVVPPASAMPEPFGTTVRAERERRRAALAEENAAAAEARAAAASRPGLRVTDDDVGPPSGRQFEFSPGPGRGLRGEIELERPNTGFEQRVRESVAAGAFDPVTPERVESARQVHQANLRALRGLRQLGAARLGVPEQFLDAVRQGNITGREAVMLAAQQPVAKSGGLTAAQLLNAQQQDRAQGLRERQFAYDQAQDINEMLISEEAPVRRQGRRAASAFWRSNPNNQNAIETMSRVTSDLLNDLGNPGWFSTLWADVLGGHPQGLFDPDTNTSVSDIMARRGFEVREQAGEPVLFHMGNPVDEWDEIQSANKDVADFLIEYVRPSRRGLRPR